MGKFEFYQDCKVTSWERDYFTVEANSYEEAEQSSGPGVAKMFRISLTAVFLMEEVRLCVILPSFCFPKKTMVTRLLRFSTRKENLS